MGLLPHIAARVLGTPLVIGQAKLEAILSMLGLHAVTDPPSAGCGPSSNSTPMASRPARVMRTRSGTAAINGVIRDFLAA